MAKDFHRIRRFRARQAHVEPILRLFEKAGFGIEYVYDNEDDARSCGVRIQPTDELSQELGTRHQILLWVDYFDEFQPRSLERIQSALEDARPRLREDIAFLVSNDPRVAEAVSTLPSATTIIALSVDRLKEFYTPAGPDFRRHLLSRVFSRDPYQLTGAVVNKWQFFGRERLIAELVASVNAGHKIGLFGLRKIGKTSVLLRLVDQLRLSNPDIQIAHLQIARVDAVRRSSDYFLWSLGQALSLGLPAKLDTQGLRLIGRYGVFSDIAPNETVSDLFLHDVALLLRRPQLRLCLVFDEIERMWPNKREPATSQWLAEFPRVWQLLRSIDQEFPGRLSMVVAGTSPECIEQDRIGATDNPLFQYIQVRYLPFLERTDAFLLLKELGGRAGLHWNDDACRMTYEQVAGHPALLRVVGSVVYSQGRDHERRRIISDPIVSEATITTARRSNPILNEMCGAIREGYPDDYMLLELLAKNKLGEYQQYSAMFPDSVQHLHGYGLVVNDTLAGRPTIAFTLLQSHIQAATRGSQSPQVSTGIPSTIDNYTIVSSLGRAGGFGRVYKALRGSEELFAIKVLHSSSLAALTRETDILGEMKHSNIVRFIDSGHDPTFGNYIVMEYLEGRPWLEYCSRASRMRPKEAKEKASQILTALHYLHPKPPKTFSHKSDVSIQDILAQSMGYIHRDIKPENIIEVPRRGPVLIDFGIASKAGDPTKTTSATPGYLPPDFIAGHWDADTDLYQAGLTLLQVLVGEVYRGVQSELEDYRRVLDTDPELSRQMKRLVLRLCEPDRVKRFGSAAEALEAMR